jgi:hypothetical protein
VTLQFLVGSLVFNLIQQDEEDEDYIESSQESTGTEATTDSMEEDNENGAGSDEEGMTTPTAGSQNGDDDIMDEADVETEPQFQSSPASSQSTQHSSREHLTPEQMLLDRYDIIPRDIKAIKRFLEHNGYSRDQKKVAIAVGWRIDSEGLQLVKTWIAQCGDEVHD